jgi:hypothetical protein
VFSVLPVVVVVHYIVAKFCSSPSSYGPNIYILPRPLSLSHINRREHRGPEEDATSSSRFTRRAGRIGEVGSGRRRVRHLRIGFADTAVGLPVGLLAVAVAVVC